MSAESSDFVACRVCGSRETAALCTTENEHSQSRRLHHHRCRRCGSVFIANVVTRDELAVAYATLDTAGYYREIDVENRRKMQVAARDLKGLVDPSSSVIDVGAGNGAFLTLLRDVGFTNLAAHEIPNANLGDPERVTNRVYRDFDYTTIPESTFDVVTLLDVAEHVIDPAFLFRNCARILRPGGFVYVHTPVVARTDRLMQLTHRVRLLANLGRIWQRGRTSIFHLQNYTPRALRLLLADAGFDEVSVAVRNELSWPVTRYIRVFLLEKQGLPGFLAPMFLPILYPILATNLLNANKAIVTARKRS